MAGILSIDFSQRGIYNPDFYSKLMEKGPQTLATQGLAAFVFCHKYVEENLIF